MFLAFTIGVLTSKTPTLLLKYTTTSILLRKAIVAEIDKLKGLLHLLFWHRTPKNTPLLCCFRHIKSPAKLHEASFGGRELFYLRPQLSETS